jgi:RNA polymerase-interacting CarD/CdnL/TRCF family regulator
VILTSGNKIIYPSQGPCLIGAIVQKMVDDRLVMFQELLVLSNGGKLFVPIDNVPTAGVRPLLKKSEIPKLFDRLKKPTRSAQNWKERARENLKLLTSGSAFALAEVVEALTELSETRALTAGDYRTLDRAKMLLICEIAEVTGQTKSVAEQEIDNALKARAEQQRTRPVAVRGEGHMRQKPGDSTTPQGSPCEPPPVARKMGLSWPWGRRQH